MAWTDSMPLMLRYLINDIDSPVYTDTRLQTMLTIAAKFVIAEFNFSQPFVSNPVALTITPDPTDSTTLDDWFANLTVYKAAIIIVRNELKADSVKAISFKEFHSAVDMTGIAKNKKMILDDLQQAYEHAELEYRMGVRVSASAVLTPFNIYSGGWRGPAMYMSDRDRFVL